MHDNSTLFQWEYIERNNADVTASYITNFVSKLSLDCFKDLKRLIVLQLLNKNNDSLLAFCNYVLPKWHSPP